MVTIIRNPLIDPFRQCNYTDMVMCVNDQVQNFLFSRNSEIEGILLKYSMLKFLTNLNKNYKLKDLCPPPCESFSFIVDQVTVSY